MGEMTCHDHGNCEACDDIESKLTAAEQRAAEAEEAAGTWRSRHDNLAFGEDMLRQQLTAAEQRAAQAEQENEVLRRQYVEDGVRYTLGIAGWKETARQLAQAEAQIAGLREALERIERWFGEFPSIQTADGPLSYGAAYGSNGERDFMREVARRALLIPFAEGGTE